MSSRNALKLFVILRKIYYDLFKAISPLGSWFFVKQFSLPSFSLKTLLLWFSNLQTLISHNIIKFKILLTAYGWNIKRICIHRYNYIYVYDAYIHIYNIWWIVLNSMWCQLMTMPRARGWPSIWRQRVIGQPAAFDSQHCQWIRHFLMHRDMQASNHPARKTAIL